MFCQIKDRATPATLGQMQAGEVFVVEGVRSLEHCVCVVGLLDSTHSDDTSASAALFTAWSKDTVLSVVVVACAKRPGTACYKPAGYEVDLARETRVTRVEQTQIAMFSAKSGAEVQTPLDTASLEPREIQAGRTLHVHAEIDLDTLLGKGSAPAAPSKL